MIDKKRLARLKVFQRLIHYGFRNRNLLNHALTHRSFAYEDPRGKSIDNERLEFLGDAVLGLAISDHIYRKSPSVMEGDMTRLRASLVSKTTLENVARRLSVGDFLLLGKGEAASGGADQPRNLVGAYEAIIGAIYLDGGFEKAVKFIDSQFKKETAKVLEDGARKDYKSVLQEYTLKNFKCTPRYMVLHEEGPQHKKHFELAVLFGGIVRGKGEGKNKKSAEQDAAYEALLSMGLLDKIA